MILRHAPAFRGMSEFYTDSKTGAPLVNDCGELADDSDMHRFLSRPDVERELDRLTFEMCAEDRLKGEKLPPWLLQAELDAFIRQRERDA
jgi:hypothetical protein